MSTGTIETYPIGIRGYEIVEREPVVIDLVHEKKRDDTWRVQPSGLPCEIYVASKEDAEECLRGVLEGLQ